LVHRGRRACLRLRKCRRRQPAPLSPIERVTEILERLFLARPDLTAELLVELGRSDTSALAKLFGPAYGSPKSI
jgi:hypothetical protein